MHNSLIRPHCSFLTRPNGQIFIIIFINDEPLNLKRFNLFNNFKKNLLNKWEYSRKALFLQVNNILLKKTNLHLSLKDIDTELWINGLASCNWYFQ